MIFLKLTNVHPFDGDAVTVALVFVDVANVVGVVEVVGPSFASASWNKAMLSGYTLMLSLYLAKMFPSWTIMLVVPTVLRQ